MQLEDVYNEQEKGWRWFGEKHCTFHESSQKVIKKELNERNEKLRSEGNEMKEIKNKMNM